MLRIGIDIGGTFTDFVVQDPIDGSITTFKLLSDPTNPAITVLQGLRRVLSDQSAQIIHGSTVATNALLERKGSRTALITTHGFRDILEIGRQNRPSLYDWTVTPAPVLVPSELRVELDERVDSHGKVLRPLDISEIEALPKFFCQNKIESVAVCLIFSFLFPHHEKMIVDILRKSGYFVSASCEILPEFREYERTSTTVVNAYVSPILDRYLSLLQNSLPNSSLQIMQSNGGMIGLDDARQNGARCILSGPAGGIIGAQNIAELIMNEHSLKHSDQTVKLITFDMGGTSTDVSLINGQPSLTSEAIVGGCPIHLPILDIHTIGAGGGSIAYVDPGSSLRVGPQSAGAYPGPACYGRGDLPTVTDANLVLGRLVPQYFLGGQMQIFPERAFTAITQLGNSINLNPIQAAFGVIEVVNAQMERAIRVISVERGHDPRDFILFSFGGAGGLHAVELARHLGIPTVIISKVASTLSAYGMLASNIVKDYMQTVMLSGNSSHKKLMKLFAPIEGRGVSEVKKEGINGGQIEIVRSMDIRYIGQSYELSIPYSKDYISEFHRAHHASYGYSFIEKPLEIVNLRVRVIGKVSPIKLPLISMALQSFNPLPMETKQVEMNSGTTSIPVFNIAQLKPGTRLEGPALIVSSDTTILIFKNDIIMVDRYQNLLIDVGVID